MYCKAKEMLQKLKPSWKDGTKMTITESLCQKIEWAEEQIIQCDKILLEDHSKIATPKQTARNEKNWVLSRNKDGATRIKKTA